MDGMAKAATSEANASASKVKLPVAMLLIVVLLGSLLGAAGAGGGLYYLMQSGKLPGGTETAQRTSEGPLHPMVLEPILANLADDGGHAYLRLGVTLNVEGAAAKGETSGEAKSGKTPSEEDLAVRDTVLAVLGQQTSTWLLGPDGKEHLKIELKDALAKRNAQLKIKDIFFTDFLVQI